MGEAEFTDFQGNGKVGRDVGKMPLSQCCIQLCGSWPGRCSLRSLSLPQLLKSTGLTSLQQHRENE